jgi:hypothetical protein
MLGWKYAARLRDRRFRVVDLDVRNALEDYEPEEPCYYIFRLRERQSSSQSSHG